MHTVAIRGVPPEVGPSGRPRKMLVAIVVAGDFVVAVVVVVDVVDVIGARSSIQPW